MGLDWCDFHNPNPSDALCVDRIVLPMSADKPDIDDAVGIVDPDHDAIFIAGNVKDDASILENARATDIPFDIRRLCPVGLSHLPKPGHHRLASVGNARASIEKGFDRAERYDPHYCILAWSHVGTMGFSRAGMRGQSVPNVFTITLNSLPSSCLCAYVRGR